MSHVSEKRKFPRFESHFPLKYKDLKISDAEYRGTVSKNVSEGGIRFRSDRFISLACRLVVEINLPTIPKPIRAVSKIAWIKKLPAGDDYEIGNQFLEISRQDKDFIRKFIEEQFKKSPF